MDSPTSDSPIAETPLSTPGLHLSQPRPTTSPAPFRLFDLPTELILQILTDTCIHHHPLQITHTQPLALQPPITRTCRLLRTEGLKLFYRNNTFRSTSTLYSLADFWSFLTCIGPTNATSIRTILIEWVSGPWEPRSLEDRTWEHFVSEMQFLTQARIPMGLQGREVFVRTKGGRVLMGQGECYEISLREGLDVTGEEWLSANALAKEDVAWRVAAHPKFWVREGEAEE